MESDAFRRTGGRHAFVHLLRLLPTAEFCGAIFAPIQSPGGNRRVEFEWPPNDFDGNMLGDPGDCLVEFPLSDIAPRTNHVGNDFDAQLTAGILACRDVLRKGYRFCRAGILVANGLF